MQWIALLRHGATEWNERGLIQGRTDTALSAAGVAALQRARPGDEFLRAHWLCSPLQRARETAAILNRGAPTTVAPDLIETNWGEFEGLHRGQLAQRIHDLKLTPKHGLDFQPPGGESARMVQRRLIEWFAAVARDNTSIVAVTHKGVIRAALGIACDWEMNNEFKPKPNWELPHVFFIARGQIRLARLNCPWRQSPSAAVELMNRAE